MEFKKRNLPDSVNISNGEVKMKELLNKIFVKKRYFDNYRPDWLVNLETGYNLEFDRYYPDLNLAFEFGGSNHFKGSQRKRDLIKQKVADSFGVVTVYVSSKQIDWFDEKRMIENIKYWKKRFNERLNGKKKSA